jgi:hypothetical protein
MARTFPLLMVAVGIDVLPHQPVAGFFYLVGAISVAILATLRLRSAEGFVPRPVNSGELHKRAFFLAKKMGIRLRRVYVFPSGKGHLTNAFGGLSSSIGISDDYGKWLRGEPTRLCNRARTRAHTAKPYTEKDWHLGSSFFAGFGCRHGIAAPAITTEKHFSVSGSVRAAHDLLCALSQVRIRSGSRRGRDCQRS